MELKHWEQTAFFSTVRITVPNQQGKSRSVGTGFFLGLPLVTAENKEKGAVILVTSKHVFGEAAGKLILTYHRTNEDGSGPVKGPGVEIEEDYSNHYVTHPDPTIDLACVGVSGLLAEPRIFFRYEGPGSVSKLDESDLRAGKKICFVGYPDGRFDSFHNLPIMRFGHIATLPQVDFMGEPAFLIDAAVFEGSSGSAVYAKLGGDYKLIGVVRSYYSREEVAEFEALNFKYEQALNMGVVLKATLIHELIDHLLEVKFPGCRLGYSSK